MEINVRNTIGEGNCRLLDALYWWAQGGHGSRVVALCYWGKQLQIARRLIMVVSSGHGLRMEALCYWGMQLQIGWCDG